MKRKPTCLIFTITRNKKCDLYDLNRFYYLLLITHTSKYLVKAVRRLYKPSDSCKSERPWSKSPCLQYFMERSSGLEIPVSPQAYTS